ncbi:MAG: DUF86 domain-containing protein [Myxococcota bacterium]|jgi:uncharacterized protein YutE (UPF0331/DUF86 family)
MLDRELITRKLVLISTDVEELRRIHASGIENYLADPYLELVSERLMERTINRMIDINFHILKASSLPPPRDYFASFTELGKMGVMDPSFASRLAGSAGLRNRIVHEYDSIDPEKIFSAIGDALADIPVYIKAISEKL